MRLSVVSYQSGVLYLSPETGQTKTGTLSFPAEVRVHRDAVLRVSGPEFLWVFSQSETGAVSRRDCESVKQ